MRTSRPRLPLLVLAALVAALGLSRAHAQEAPSLGEVGSQRLALAPGANLVSLYVYPDDLTLDVLFGNVTADLTVTSAAGSNLAYNASRGIRTLDRWSWDHAYVVYNGSDEALSVDMRGRVIQPTSAIVLEEGWHQIPYLGQSALPVGDALASIAASLTTIRDEDGRSFPTPGRGGALVTLEPGQGYRLHLSRPDTLVWSPTAVVEAPPLPPGDPIVVGTIEEALALRGLRPNADVVRVIDPLRGGLFNVTDSGRPTDGGTVFVPLEHSTETSVSRISGHSTLYDGPTDEGIVFDSFRLYYGDRGEYLTAVHLHGHNANIVNDGYPRFVAAPGSLDLSDMGSVGPFSVTYRYATGPVRLERVVPPLELERDRPATADYVRPEWWGAEPYPDSWTPDPTSPTEGGRPYTTPTGDYALGGRYDATDALATAINAAATYADDRGREQYVVLAGMYGFGRTIEVRDRVVLKGRQKDKRESQGLRFVKGSAWHTWAVKIEYAGGDPAYAEPRTVYDYLGNPDAKVYIRHGRQSTLNRLVDLEIDGNAVENDYVFSPEYRTASGPSGGAWSNEVEHDLQNTPHWNGFVAQAGDHVVGSNARLENVYIHDVGGNQILGQSSVTFEGSRDLWLHNAFRNHVAYRTLTGTGWVDGVLVTGTYWLGAFETQQGNFRNVTFRDLEPNPYGLGSPTGAVGHRNDGIPDERMASEFYLRSRGSYYWGDTVLIDGLTIDLSDGFATHEVIGYDNGPITYRNVRFVNAPGRVTRIVGDKGDTQQIGRGHFTLEDATFDANGGSVGGLVPSSASRINLRRVSWDRTNDGDVMVLRSSSQRQTVTLYDVEQGDVEDPPGGYFFILRPRSADAPGAQIYIQRSRLGKRGMVRDAAQIWGGMTAAEWRARHSFYVKDSDLYGYIPTSMAYYGPNVTVIGRGNRTSYASGSLSGAPLVAGAVDVDPDLFQEPADASFVTLTGPDAPRFTGWTNVGTEADPILRLSFRGSDPVTVNWEAAVNPIPDGVTFPE